MIGMFLAALVTNFLGKELHDDEVYQARLARGEVRLRGASSYEAKPGAKRSVLLFLADIVAVVLYATAISDSVGLIADPPLPRDEAIVVFMLTIATLIALF
nr:Anaerobic C4-dicarboxylate transporter DcuA [Candidatus Pantoea persica]